MKDGRVAQETFDTYNVIRLDERPEVEVITVPAGGFWGGGEPLRTIHPMPVLNTWSMARSNRIAIRSGRRSASAFPRLVR